MLEELWIHFQMVSFLMPSSHEVTTVAQVQVAALGLGDHRGPQALSIIFNTRLVFVDAWSSR